MQTPRTHLAQFASQSACAKAVKATAIRRAKRKMRRETNVIVEGQEEDTGAEESRRGTVKRVGYLFFFFGTLKTFCFSQSDQMFVEKKNEKSMKTLNAVVYALICGIESRK